MESVDNSTRTFEQESNYRLDAQYSNLVANHHVSMIQGQMSSLTLKFQEGGRNLVFDTDLVK